MNTFNKIKTAAAAVALSAVCLTATAQPRHHHYHRHGARTVVVKPVAATVTSNNFSSQDRLAMAVAYLKRNSTISAKQYAKLTGLTRSAAKAELAAFATGHHKPLAAVAKGRKTLYTLRG